jgi:septum formation protein
MRLVLASASPRRRELLRKAGFEFDVQPGHVAEEMRRDERPEEFARRVARDKALHVAASTPPGCLVLGADTVVVVDGETLGKPLDPADATRMLRLLSGRTHQVHTGVCLVKAPRHIETLTHETTRVTFRKLDEEEIRRYVESGEPADKAGAYAVQGLASKFVTRISGCYSNVVGLPVARVYGMLKKAESSRQWAVGKGQRAAGSAQWAGAGGRGQSAVRGGLRAVGSKLWTAHNGQ